MAATSKRVSSMKVRPFGSSVSPTNPTICAQTMPCMTSAMMKLLRQRPTLTLEGSSEQNFTASACEMNSTTSATPSQMSNGERGTQAVAMAAATSAKIASPKVEDFRPLAKS